MNNHLKAIVIFICTAVLLACGPDSTETNQSKTASTQSKLITDISADTQRAGFGQPASAEKIAIVAKELGSYFNGQYANNPEALAGAKATTKAAVQIAPQAVSASNIAKQVYRFYNANTSAHFYTMSVSERDYILQTFPFFSYEGGKFYAYPDPDPTLSPVYRFYNKVTATHFYTINAAEKDQVIANWVPSIFNFEGIAWYASAANGAEWDAVYRFFNLQTGTHFYTASAAEKDHIIATWNWFRYEGIAYYVPKEAGLVKVTGIAPTAATLGVATTFTVIGTNLPTTAILAVQDAVCQTPTGNTATGFSQICTPGGALGAKVITVKTAPGASGGVVIDASRSVNVTNTPVPLVNSVSPTTATLSQATTFTVMGTNLPLTASLTIADATCNAATGNTATGFSQVCIPGGAVGTKVITVKTAASGTVIDATRSVNVTTVVIPPVTSLLNDSGITSSQCYQAGSDSLVSCLSSGAIALNNKQDGMVGRDVTTSSTADGKLGFSFSTVGGYPITDCVKDDVTDLVWEGKPTTGTRSSSLLLYKTASANTAANYIAAVNSSNLCGYADWRLPSAEELHGLIDYGSATSPRIDSTWFPNTLANDMYLTSTVPGCVSAYCLDLYVSFLNGKISLIGSGSSGPIRLVRGLSSPSYGVYSYSADGSEVTDSSSGLTWRRCSEGQTWNGTACLGSVSTFTHESALTHAQNQTGWRMPNIKELKSYRIKNSANNTVNTTAFPNEPACGYYWSSTPDVSSVWALHTCLTSLRVANLSRGTLNYLRLVR